MKQATLDTLITILTKVPISRVSPKIEESMTFEEYVHTYAKRVVDAKMSASVVRYYPTSTNNFNYPYIIDLNQREGILVAVTPLHLAQYKPKPNKPEAFELHAQRLREQMRLNIEGKPEESEERQYTFSPSKVIAGVIQFLPFDMNDRKTRREFQRTFEEVSIWNKLPGYQELTGKIGYVNLPYTAESIHRLHRENRPKVQRVA